MSAKDLNPRQEAFARGLFEGKTAGQAYRDAGYKQGKCADSGATQLRKNPKIKAYLEELRKEADERSLMTVEFKRKKLREMLEADPREVVKEPGAGWMLKKYKRTTTHDGQEVEEIMIPDPVAVINADNALAGHGKGSAENPLHVNLANVLEELPETDNLLGD